MRTSIMAAIVILIVAAGAGYYWYTAQTPQTVQIQQKGSDTLLILAQRWAEEYMKTHRNVEIVVSGGGSGTGISALINKQIDIADASREIKKSEIDQAKVNGVNPVEWKVAIDGISIIINKNNPIREITLDELRRIYNGTITKWSQIGGKDAPVIAYGRQSTSGTYVYFEEEVLKNDKYRSDMNQLAGNAEIVQAVINDPNGIGYVGVGYAEGRKNELSILSVKKNADSTPYQPTISNILSKNYPISRFLYVYTNGVPEGAVKDYIKFMLSSEGQNIVEQVGYIKVPQEILTEQLNKLK
ncbi:PstS family phosphate ABC transporter substrate-binding protein [Candidatus Bathyarchaeota archaeon]|nr:PstS family phosphate ABC transporter substrate-binding protein [Candidatus Bathyarchaeota archaeon]MBS7630800.1 PstS family phosphate ABC transporter substrate-binding protein [Candidatus Bathyarchaeota archaeon]